MSKYLIKRILIAVPVLWGVTVVVFILMHLAPGDPIMAMMTSDFDKGTYELLRHQFGLDQPLPVQYLLWLSHILQGDLGRDMMARRPVLEWIADTIPTTLTLAVGSIIIAVVVGIPLGIVAAVRREGIFDGISRVAAVIGVSMPVFWLGMLMIILFAVQFRWFPAGGSMSEFGLKAMILPSLALGLSMAALIMRMTRSSMLDVLGEDYVRTARAKGLKEALVLQRHALGNALIPVVTVVGLQFGNVLGGAVLTEIVFSLPGLGRMMVEAIARRDYPLVEGTVLAVSVLFVFVNLMVDMLYGIIDPRIRYD